jgi:hypothetical protein
MPIILPFRRPVVPVHILVYILLCLNLADIGTFHYIRSGFIPLSPFQRSPATPQRAGTRWLPGPRKSSNMGHPETSKILKWVRPVEYNAIDSCKRCPVVWHGANFELDASVSLDYEYRWIQVIAGQPAEIWNLRQLPDTLVDGDRDQLGNLTHYPFYYNDQTRDTMNNHPPDIAFTDRPRSHTPGKHWEAQLALLAFDPRDHKDTCVAKFTWGYEVKTVGTRQKAFTLKFKRIYTVWRQTQYLIDSLTHQPLNQLP